MFLRFFKLLNENGENLRTIKFFYRTTDLSYSCFKPFNKNKIIRLLLFCIYVKDIFNKIFKLFIEKLENLSINQIFYRKPSFSKASCIFTYRGRGRQPHPGSAHHRGGPKTFSFGDRKLFLLGTEHFFVWGPKTLYREWKLNRTIKTKKTKTPRAGASTQVP